VVRPTATRNQYCYIETTVTVISLIRNTQNDVYLTMAHLLAYQRTATTTGERDEVGVGKKKGTN
jgi:hypothetical protein